MANDTNDTRTVLGRGTRVRGRITGGQDLEIHGHVEGEIAASGEVSVESTGTVSSSIAAHSIVVRGAVRGDLTAEDSVHLEDGARVVGDVRAPRIAIAQGALVKGYVQTGEASAQRPAAARKAVAAAPAVRTAPVAVARPVVATPPRKVEKPVAAPPPPPAPVKRPVVTLAGAKAAPSPVVPALKKGAKGALAKKRG
jgi:cytoskeletal protein CcmA (bactofilin family)